MAAKPIVVHSSKKQTATVIFLHGLGDTGEGWASSISNIRRPFAKIICPTAPMRPITWRDGYRMPAWFDIFSLDTDSREDEDGIVAATATIHDLIRKEEENGIPSDRIVLGGFSMGGALALYATLTYPKRIAGVFSLGGWLPLNAQFPSVADGSNSNTPILVCHGEADPIVAVEWGRASTTLLKSFCSNVEMKTYRKLGHGYSDKVKKDFRSFLANVLPPA